MSIRQKIIGFMRDNQNAWAWILLVLSALVLLFGVFYTLTYAVPLHTGDYNTAVKSGVGEPALALYGKGLELYRQKSFDESIASLSNGYTTLTDKSGQIPESRQKLAGNFQLLIGNSLFYKKKLPEAAEAYRQALRHDPDNMTAKYNLELILTPPPQNGGGQGNGQGNGQQPGQPGTGQPQPGQPGQQPGTQPGTGAGSGPKKGI